MNIKKYLSEALLIAIEGESLGEVPVGAVLVKDGSIIAKAHNSRELKQDPTGHAEMNVLKAGALVLNSWRLLDCELYITLEPCPMCLSACQQARIKKVVYGAKDEKGGAICLGFHTHSDVRLNHQFEVIYEPIEECSQILKDFFLKQRNQKKSDKL